MSVDVQTIPDGELLEMWRSVSGSYAQLTGPLIRFAGKIQQATAEAHATERIRQVSQSADAWQKAYLDEHDKLTHAEQTIATLRTVLERIEESLVNDPSAKAVMIRATIRGVLASHAVPAPGAEKP